MALARWSRVMEIAVQEQLTVVNWNVGGAKFLKREEGIWSEVLPEAAPETRRTTWVLSGDVNSGLDAEEVRSGLTAEFRDATPKKGRVIRPGVSEVTPVIPSTTFLSTTSTGTTRSRHASSAGPLIPFRVRSRGLELVGLEELGLAAPGGPRAAGRTLADA